MSDLSSAFQAVFQKASTFLAQAPGRVEFLGNHTDYNGGEVLGAAVNAFLNVAVCPRDDDRVNLSSDGPGLGPLSSRGSFGSSGGRDAGIRRV